MVSSDKIRKRWSEEVAPCSRLRAAARGPASTPAFDIPVCGLLGLVGPVARTRSSVWPSRRIGGDSPKAGDQLASRWTPGCRQHGRGDRRAGDTGGVVGPGAERQRVRPPAPLRSHSQRDPDRHHRGAHRGDGGILAGRSRQIGSPVPRRVDRRSRCRQRRGWVGRGTARVAARRERGETRRYGARRVGGIGRDRRLSGGFRRVSVRTPTRREREQTTVAKRLFDGETTHADSQGKCRARRRRRGPRTGPQGCHPSRILPTQTAVLFTRS